MTSLMLMHHSRDTLIIPKSSYHLPPCWFYRLWAFITFLSSRRAGVKRTRSMEACYGRAVQGEGSCGTLFPQTVNSGICQSCSTLTSTTPTNVRRGVCKGRDGLATDKDFPWAIGSTGAPSLLMVVFAVNTSCCGHVYHLNTDISSTNVQILTKLAPQYSFFGRQSSSVSSQSSFKTVLSSSLCWTSYLQRPAKSHCLIYPTNYLFLLH
jgi:hypothetical protein